MTLFPQSTGFFDVETGSISELLTREEREPFMLFDGSLAASAMGETLPAYGETVSVRLPSGQHAVAWSDGRYAQFADEGEAASITYRLLERNQLASGLASIDGDDGNDSLAGGNGDDQLLSGFGDDILNGGSGNGNLSGGAGHDELLGGDGKDTIKPGIGRDTVYLSSDIVSGTLEQIYGNHFVDF